MKRCFFSPSLSLLHGTPSATAERFHSRQMICTRTVCGDCVSRCEPADQRHCCTFDNKITVSACGRAARRNGHAMSRRHTIKMFNESIEDFDLLLNIAHCVAVSFRRHSKAKRKRGSAATHANVSPPARRAAGKPHSSGDKTIQDAGRELIPSQEK